MSRQLVIEYANPQALDNTYTLSFKIRSHSVAQRWAHKVSIATKKYPIDNPDRFFCFGSREQQIFSALMKINETIDIINKFDPIVTRKLTDVNDQDTLNYLHHIFEVYHGLLGQQTHELWQRAPDTVRRALADLNIQVHECECISRIVENKPSHIVTWYGLPKIDTLRDDEYKIFDEQSNFGTVYLLYTEIGKTLEDLSIDDDHYIHESAFRPFRHYSADFHVKFYSDDSRQIEEKRAIIKEYYNKNQEFFIKQGLPWGHPYLSWGLIPLADLEIIPKDLLEIITTRQWVKSVNIL